jgi:RNA polymerase sigma factor (sigma-70 family)
VSVLAERSAIQGFVDRGIDFDAVYDEQVPIMIGMAVKRFHLAEQDAQVLAHEVFLAFFMRAEEIRDHRAWLIGAMCNACRELLRKSSRDVALPDDIANRPDPKQESHSISDQITAQELQACCSARCQLALRLRYIEGYSIAEIAALLKTTPKYAQNLVSRCLQQARDRNGIKSKRSKKK